jgi:glyoxylase-like metal-dependent hydrolase (beta-lactamase superfamily II)
LRRQRTLRGVISKQEKEPASEEIAEVAPGVVRMQLPIAFTGLGHVNCYALEDDRGFAVVDPGLPGPDAWDGLLDRLTRARIPLSRIHTVVVTHSHPDHFGGAARLRAETGADILTHSSFKLWWERDGLDDRPSDALDDPDHWSRPTPWGTQFEPPSDGAISEMRDEMRSGEHTPRPTKRVTDGEMVMLGRREWVAMHTPGHTPDHLCLFDPVNGVVLAGDHVLPSITPHIGAMDGGAEDPLAKFFHALDRMAELRDVKVSLPAHGHPFHDLAKRVDEIKEHHIGRLQRLRDASAELGRPATVHELMQHLFAERAWGSMAESETYAHLEHLRLSHEATSNWADGLLRYEVIPEQRRDESVADDPGPMSSVRRRE